MGITSYNLLYLFTEQLLANKKSLIIESNFKSEIDTVKLLDLKSKYQFSLVQIYCYTSVKIALQRFKNRAISGARHPGHVDHLIYAEMDQIGNKEAMKSSIFAIAKPTLRVIAR